MFAAHFVCLNSPRDRRDKHLGADFASEDLEEVAPVVQAEEARSPDIEPVQTCRVACMSVMQQR